MAAVLAAVAAAGVGTVPSRVAAQQFPFGSQHQAYRSGTLVPTNFTRAQQNQHVANYYDYWKSRWLVTDPGGHGWRVKQKSDGTTVSEGQGYGMVIVATMAGHDPQAKTIFDGLWEFRLAHPSEIDSRLMDWNVPLSSGNDSAFDGDMDIAYGLLMAHAQWGSGGAINYLAEARNVIAGIRESTIGPNSRLPMLGDWVTPGGINSTATYSQWTTRSSDFLPGHFRAFGAATGDAAYWSGVTTAVQNVIANIQVNESSATGLLPDFIRLVGSPRDPQPAPADFLEGAQDGQYWYNAGRDPWRLGVDAILNNDPTTLAQVQKLAQWIRSSTGGVVANIGGGYRLDGTPLNTWEDHFFIAPFAVSAMTGTTAADQTWLNSLYSYIYQRHNNGDYYADAVTLQSLLAVTGNFWDPLTVLASTPLAGDFDRDGVVDGDDYAAWRAAFGSTTSPNVDGNGDGVVDAADFTIWRDAMENGQGSASGAVPEAETLLLLAFATVQLCAVTRIPFRGGRVR
ncbi:MAG: glycosyl hydrolase family 8 [Pirellulales bacterium]